MPKGQQRSNREKKKPKKQPQPVAPRVPGTAARALAEIALRAYKLFAVREKICSRAASRHHRACLRKQRAERAFGRRIVRSPGDASGAECFDYPGKKTLLRIAHVMRRELPG